MPFLLNYPQWVGVVVVVLILAVVAIVTHVTAAHRSRSTDENEVAGVYMLQVGVLYAVLLAFVVVVAWEDYVKAGDTTAREINALGDLYRTAGGMPAQQRTLVRNNILAYVRLVRTEEWPAMQHGGSSDAAQQRAEVIAEAVDRFRPATLGEANTHAAELGLVKEFLDGRRERINKNTAGIPLLLYWSLWVGAVITIGYTAFMRVGRRGWQLMLTVVLAVLIGIVLSLVVEFEYPYRGQISVPITGWVNLERALTSRFIQ